MDGRVLSDKQRGIEFVFVLGLLCQQGFDAVKLLRTRIL